MASSLLSGLEKILLVIVVRTLSVKASIEILSMKILTISWGWLADSNGHLRAKAEIFPERVRSKIISPFARSNCSFVSCSAEPRKRNTICCAEVSDKSKLAMISQCTPSPAVNEKGVCFFNHAGSVVLFFLSELFHFPDWFTCQLSIRAHSDLTR